MGGIQKGKTESPVLNEPGTRRPTVLAAVLILPALAIYTFLAYHLNFTQDDAFISFRYVANFLSGHGLVYNLGERIEGITNFGWTMYLIAWGALGANYITVAKISGFLLGAGTIIVTYLMGRRLLGEIKAGFVLVPVYLVAANQSLAYWSPAGLETAAFAFLTALCLYLFLKRSRFLTAAIMLTVWVRPEGALLAILFVLIESFLERRMPSYSLGAAGLAFLFALPWLAFKWSYYGSILPNPFYAKTGLTFTQISNGLGYAGQFFKDYGFVGVGWIVPLLFFGKLSKEMKAVWLFGILYTLYVVLIGGDVLKIHRFFVPLLGVSGILAALTLSLLMSRLGERLRILALFFATAALLAISYVLPLKNVEYYGQSEIALTDKMAYLAQHMAKADSTRFSVALTTIGSFGYQLLGHYVIDMLGLTDSVVARHPETQVADLESTWRESKFASRYLLKRAPDYVLFSTGQKPSAPAEQTLMLYPAFLTSYRLVTWKYGEGPPGLNDPLIVVYKKVRPVDQDPQMTLPIEWVAAYKSAQERYGSQDYSGALNKFIAIMDDPKAPWYPEMYYFMAECYARTGRNAVAHALLDSVVAKDSMTEIAHGELYIFESLFGDSVKVQIHRRWLERLSPWEIRRLDGLIEFYRKNMPRRQ